MIARSLIAAAGLLVLAGMTGVALEDARREAGVEPTVARVPLGGFEPLAVNLYYLRAETLFAERRLPEAIAAVRVVTELQPRVADAWSILGSILFWQVSESSGDPEERWRWAKEGLAILDRGLELNPDARPILRTKGTLVMDVLCADAEVRAIAERELGRPPESIARKTFQTLVRIDPSILWELRLADTTALLAEQMLAKGDTASARALFREALVVLRRAADGPDPGLTPEKVQRIEKRLEELGD